MRLILLIATFAMFVDAAPAEDTNDDLFETAATWVKNNSKNVQSVVAAVAAAVGEVEDEPERFHSVSDHSHSHPLDFHHVHVLE